MLMVALVPVPPMISVKVLVVVQLLESFDKSQMLVTGTSTQRNTVLVEVQVSAKIRVVRGLQYRGKTHLVKVLVLLSQALVLVKVLIVALVPVSTKGPVKVLSVVQIPEP